MFRHCTNLNEITCLATDTWEWLDGVAASGTFTKATSMTDWTAGSAVTGPKEFHCEAGSTITAGLL